MTLVFLATPVYAEAGQWCVTASCASCGSRNFSERECFSSKSSCESGVAQARVGNPSGTTYTTCTEQGGTSSKGGSSTDDEAARALGSAIGQALACKMFGFGCPGQPEDPAARANYYGMSAEQKQKLIAAVKAQEAEDQATADRVKAVTEGGAPGDLQLRDPDATRGNSLSDPGFSSMDFDDYRKREAERAKALRENKQGRKLSKKEQNWCKLHVPLKPTGSVQKVDGQDDGRMALFKIKQAEWDSRCAARQEGVSAQ